MPLHLLKTQLTMLNGSTLASLVIGGVVLGGLVALIVHQLHTALLEQGIRLPRRFTAAVVLVVMLAFMLRIALPAEINAFAP